MEKKRKSNVWTQNRVKNNIPCMSPALLRSKAKTSPLLVPAITTPSKHVNGPSGVSSHTASSDTTKSVCIHRRIWEPFTWNTQIVLVMSSHWRLMMSCLEFSVSGVVSSTTLVTDVRELLQ